MFRRCRDAAAHAARLILSVLRSALPAAPTREQPRARLAEPCRKIQTGASVTLAASRWRQFSDITMTLPCVNSELPAEIEDEEALRLAIERNRQIRSGEVAPISHDQLMAKLRQ